jgi:hypothetical protein
MKYLAVFLVSAALFALMGWALRFSRYRQRRAGCCAAAGRILGKGHAGRKERGI